MAAKVHIDFTDEEMDIIARIKRHMEREQGKTTTRAAIRWALHQAAKVLRKARKA